MKRESFVYKGLTFHRYPESKHASARKYFSTRISLHRLIYTDTYGPIPPGMDVHHKDRNTLNNSPENLELKEDGEHSRHHIFHREYVLRKRSDITCERCGKPANRAHGNNGKPARYCSPQCQWKADNDAKKRPLRKLQCPFCRRDFETRDKRKKFCSPTCTDDWYNLRRCPKKLAAHQNGKPISC